MVHGYRAASAAQFEYRSRGGGGGDGDEPPPPVTTSDRSRSIVQAPRDSMPTQSTPRWMRNSPLVPGMPHEPHELMSFQYWMPRGDVPQP